MTTMTIGVATALFGAIYLGTSVSRWSQWWYWHRQFPTLSREEQMGVLLNAQVEQTDLDGRRASPLEEILQADQIVTAASHHEEKKTASGVGVPR